MSQYFAWCPFGTGGFSILCVVRTASLMKPAVSVLAGLQFPEKVVFHMGLDNSEAPGESPGNGSSDGTPPIQGLSYPLQLASAVMFVAELDRSVAFYREFLDWDVTVHNESVALLVSPDGYQLYLRTRGRRAQHPVGTIGVQYLAWTARNVADLRRCEQMLRKYSTQVTCQTVDGFTLIEGYGPDHVPVMVTYPGPAQAPRHEILQRIYGW